MIRLRTSERVACDAEWTVVQFTYLRQSFWQWLGDSDHQKLFFLPSIRKDSIQDSICQIFRYSFWPHKALYIRLTSRNPRCQQMSPKWKIVNKTWWDIRASSHNSLIVSCHDFCNSKIANFDQLWSRCQEYILCFQIAMKYSLFVHIF